MAVTQINYSVQELFLWPTLAQKYSDVHLLLFCGILELDNSVITDKVFSALILCISVPVENKVRTCTMGRDISLVP